VAYDLSCWGDAMVVSKHEYHVIMNAKADFTLSEVTNKPSWDSGSLQCSLKQAVTRIGRTHPKVGNWHFRSEERLSRQQSSHFT
jgi:hypothetical protein